MTDDRKYSDPNKWDISIDHDDAPDGSEGGYDRHGNFIRPAAMLEIVRLRKAESEIREAAEMAYGWLWLTPANKPARVREAQRLLREAIGNEGQQRGIQAAKDRLYGGAQGGGGS